MMWAVRLACNVAHTRCNIIVAMLLSTDSERIYSQPEAITELDAQLLHPPLARGLELLVHGDECSAICRLLVMLGA